MAYPTPSTNTKHKFSPQFAVAQAQAIPPNSHLTRHNKVETKYNFCIAILGRAKKKFNLVILTEICKLPMIMNIVDFLWNEN
jgi:hypothetical protein